MARQSCASCALSALFDSRVRVATRAIEPLDANAAPPPHLEKAPPARRAQFAAGRSCARAALAAAGARDAVAVGVDRANAPVWPFGFVGSIAHTDAIACAAAASLIDFRAIGLDIEPVVDEGAFHLLRSVVLRSDEEPIVGTSLRAMTIAFSAKESLFKCIAPLAGVPFDFTDVRMVAIEKNGDFRIEVKKSIGRVLARGFVVSGRYSVHGRDVLTAVALEQRP